MCNVCVVCAYPSLQCIYCEKTFKDMPTLKEHMRKKQHKRVNPSNHGYDKYYMVNYLELGKTWEQVLHEDDEEEEEGEGTVLLKSK